MYLDLPIEQVLRRRDTRFQLGFGAEAKEMVPQRDEYMLLPSHKGLHVLGRNEDALSPPIEVLLDIYGERLEVEPPKVRLIEGVQVQEPIVHVRLSLESRSSGQVKQALERRGAHLTEEYTRSTYCVLRYEAALADLLGLSTELGKITDGSAKHWVVLSHYAIVTRDPGGNAA